MLNGLLILRFAAHSVVTHIACIHFLPLSPTRLSAIKEPFDCVAVHSKQNKRSMNSSLFKTSKFFLVDKMTSHSCGACIQSILWSFFLGNGHTLCVSISLSVSENSKPLFVSECDQYHTLVFMTSRMEDAMMTTMAATEMTATRQFFIHFSVVRQT